MTEPLSQYQMRVADHLAKHRPTEHQALKENGDLDKHVREVGDQLDEAVESYRQRYLQKNPIPMAATFLERARLLKQAQQIADEVMTREYLSWDEEQLAEIGPSGGYED